MSSWIGRRRYLSAFIWDHEHEWRIHGNTHVNGGKIVVGEWMIIVISSGGNLTAVIGSRLACSAGKCESLITVLPLKLPDVEPVCIFPSTNFGQDFFVVVIAQCTSKLLVRHVWSAIPVAPQTSDLVGLYNGELTA